MDLLTRSGRLVSRLALAAHPETPAECVAEALRGGIDAFFFYDRTAQGLLDGLAAELRTQRGLRDEVFLVTGTEARDIGGARADLDAARERLGVDALDAFLLLYVAPDDDADAIDGQLDALTEWKREGVIRHAGVSAHSRPLAARYAADPRVDVLMHRYNMAHRGAEEHVLPAAAAAATPVVAFTCTRWGTLLAGHDRWDGPPPTAVDCYRFALAQPAVRVALTAPHGVDELRENLAALAGEAPDDAALAAWRRYGDLIHGDGTSEFETRWP